MLTRVLPFLFIIALVASAEPQLGPRQAITIPNFVLTYAPLVYLDENELYLPSDIQAQLNNTYPALNFTSLPKANVPAPLLLSDLEQLNGQGNCVEFGTCDLFLTSKDNVTANPAWLNGVLPNPSTGETIGARSCAIIVNGHGDGLVDAYYMYFYAFNLGETVLGQVLGDHVGDWEHSMVRFDNGKPISVWLSQHDYGQAFTYDSLAKNASRPIIYSAIGSHANFAVPGTHSRNISTVVVNDFTSPGPVWDPTLSAYFYTFSPASNSNGTFASPNASTPISWLYFLGKWGDEQYPDSDPRQVNFLNLNLTYKYESGPTGPLDKDLNRIDVCPSSAGVTCSTLTALPATSGSSIPVTITRTSTSSSSGTTTGIGSSSSSASSTTSGSQSATGTSAGAHLELRVWTLTWSMALMVLI